MPVALISSIRIEEMATTHHDLVRLSTEMALAVNAYNSHISPNVDEIVRLTVLYLAKLKHAVDEGAVEEYSISNYYALVGKVWSAVDAGVYSG